MPCLKQYLNKPDGKPGWASHFLGQGYTVYIVDWYSTGRSADTSLPMLLGASPVELVEKGFTAPENYKQYYQAQFHTQWPGVSHFCTSYSHLRIVQTKHPGKKQPPPYLSRSIARANQFLQWRVS